MSIPAHSPLNLLLILFFSCFYFFFVSATGMFRAFQNDFGATLSDIGIMCGRTFSLIAFLFLFRSLFSFWFLFSSFAPKVVRSSLRILCGARYLLQCLVGSLAMPVWGGLGDRSSRKLLLCFGCFAWGGLTLGCAMSTSFMWFTVHEEVQVLLCNLNHMH